MKNDKGGGVLDAKKKGESKSPQASKQQEKNWQEDEKEKVVGQIKTKD